MPSFDVVSKLEWSEVTNAMDQARREIGQRFDFKGTDATIERQTDGLLITASTEDRVRAAFEVLREKLARRKVSLKHFEAQEPTPGPRSNSKMLVKISEGIIDCTAQQLELPSSSDIVRRFQARSIPQDMTRAELVSRRTPLIEWLVISVKLRAETRGYIVHGRQRDVLYVLGERC